MLKGGYGFGGPRAVEDDVSCRVPDHGALLMSLLELRAVPQTPLRKEVATRLPFAPHEARLRPSAHAGLVSRAGLTARLMGAVGDVVAVVAPAGYGKTTLLSSWIQADPRPGVWMSLDTAHNDPVVLLTGLALALDAVEPIDPTVLAPLWDREVGGATASLARFGRMLSSRRTAVVLVLDNVHELVAPEALDAVALVVADLPDCSTLALAGRTMPAIDVGRLRGGQVVRVDTNDLAFGVSETTTMYRALGLELTPADVGSLVARTEGWPSALYLAALSISRPPDKRRAVAEFGGDDWLIVDYLRDELLDDLDPDTHSFLLGASCLEELSGPLCDAVLARTGSARLLEELERRHLLVMAADDEGQSFRLHLLLRDMLRSELARHHPGHRSDLHRRASTWFEEKGDPDSAIEHAAAAGDLARAEALVCAHFVAGAGRGAHAMIGRWLTLFPAEHLAARPVLVVIAAHCRYAAGDGAGSALWLARAERLVDLDDPFDDGRGWTPHIAAAILRATIGRTTAQEMAENAAYACRHLPHGAWHSMCRLLVGAGAFMVADEDLAWEALAEGAAEAAGRAPGIEALCLAHLAVLHAEQDEWDEATVLACRARELLSTHGLEEAPSLFLVTALSCVVEARLGHVAEAEADRRLTQRHLAGYASVSPWATVQAWIALIRSRLILGDRNTARAWLDEVERLSDQLPDAARVRQQLVELRRSVSQPTEVAGVGPAALTAAEIRVLHYLQTHLTLAEIADRLYVSRNTVKSQAIAVYRKLGAASRRVAVDAARQAGLFEAAVERE